MVGQSGVKGDGFVVPLFADDVPLRGAAEDHLLAFSRADETVDSVGGMDLQETPAAAQAVKEAAGETAGRFKQARG